MTLATVANSAAIGKGGTPDIDLPRRRSNSGPAIPTGRRGFLYLAWCAQLDGSPRLHQAMAKPTFYRVIDRPDGLFDIEVMVAGNPMHRRCGFLSLAEVDTALDDLRALMTACGAPLVRAEFGDVVSTDELTDIHVADTP